VAQIEIIPYQIRWLEEFRVIGAEVRAALGSAVQIHHIGSTSVPGLAAKDVLDIQVGLTNLEQPELRPALEGCGFVWRDIHSDHTPPGMVVAAHDLEKRYAVRLERRVNLHIRGIGRLNQRYALLCRDYLRTHAGTRDAYAEIKHQLARYFPNNVDAYYDIKDPAFDLFMAGAWEWAEWTGWQPAPSDA
jgi:GrpB-like predicted nucleotidyltransferase (UPF0157 family)